MSDFLYINQIQAIAYDDPDTAGGDRDWKHDPNRAKQVGVRMFPFNLNEGSQGKTIYFWVGFTDDPADAITDVGIAPLEGGKIVNFEGYYKATNDLNEGAHGTPDIFLLASNTTSRRNDGRVLVGMAIRIELRRYDGEGRLEEGMSGLQYIYSDTYGTIHKDDNFKAGYYESEVMVGNVNKGIDDCVITLFAYYISPPKIDPKGYQQYIGAIGSLAYDKRTDAKLRDWNQEYDMDIMHQRMLSIDCNAHTGGKWVYLCVGFTLRPSHAITDLVLAAVPDRGLESLSSLEYFAVSRDLNEGAKDHRATAVLGASREKRRYEGRALVGLSLKKVDFNGESEINVVYSDATGHIHQSDEIPSYLTENTLVNEIGNLNEYTSGFVVTLSAYYAIAKLPPPLPDDKEVDAVIAGQYSNYNAFENFGFKNMPDVLEIVTVVEDNKALVVQTKLEEGGPVEIFKQSFLFKIGEIYPGTQMKIYSLLQSVSGFSKMLPPKDGKSYKYDYTITLENNKSFQRFGI